jgi:hypothetical protein
MLTAAAAAAAVVTGKSNGLRRYTNLRPDTAEKESKQGISGRYPWVMYR